MVRQLVVEGMLTVKVEWEGDAELTVVRATRRRSHCSNQRSGTRALLQYISVRPFACGVADCSSPVFVRYCCWYAVCCRVVHVVWFMLYGRTKVRRTTCKLVSTSYRTTCHADLLRDGRCSGASVSFCNRSGVQLNPYRHIHDASTYRALSLHEHEWRRVCGVLVGGVLSS